MLRSELGTKRICPNCAAKFYDLGRNPVECPKCGHSFVPEVDRKPSKASAKVAKTTVAAATKDAPPPPEAKESRDEVSAVEPAVSFEEADQEASGASSSRAAALDEDNATGLPDSDGDGDGDDDDDDTTLLQETDDFDEDVASIVDSDIKKES